MRKHLLFVFILIILLFSLSGCDSPPPIEQMQDTTSIVGMIGNINKTSTEFVIKAYLKNDLNMPVSKGIADKDGYFQVTLPQEGTYLLKIDYTFNGKTFEYPQPYTYDERIIYNIQVKLDKIANVGVIYTSLEDVYFHKVLQELNNISQGLRYSGDVEVLINNDSPKNFAVPNSDKSFRYRYGVLENSENFSFVISVN